MVVGFFAISLYFGFVGYIDFQLQNPTDAGIITQAVASTTHGHVTPFYESWDCLHKSRCSFLLVHPAFVLYAAAPFYLLAPSTVTLFALRSAVVAVAAIPLYWLTRQVTRSPGKGLLAAGLFLVWAPTFAGDAFSLHLESLFPLELFLLAALWQSGRYRLGLAVAAVAFLTYEVSPLFVFLVGLFFLSPFITRAFRDRWDRWRSERATGRSTRWSLSLWLGTVREGWRTREVRYLFVLMGASVAAYIALSLFINVWGCEILGVACPSIQPGIGGVFSNPSSPGFHSLGTILQSSQTISTAEYWLILYALVAFVPLLSRRALILSVPWIGWTFLTVGSNFTTIGREYSLIAAGPIFIGLAYGLDRIPIEWLRASPLAKLEVSTTTGRRVDSSFRPVRRRRARFSRTAWVGTLAVVVIANGLLMPINPALSDLGLAPRTPFTPNYFDHSLEISPGFEWVEQLLSTVPPTATIVAPAPLFPLVANYPHAYLWAANFQMNASNLPFNVSGGPQYALVSSGLLGSLGPELFRNLSDPLLYGMRAYVGISPLGPIMLYEKGYSLPSTLFGPEGAQTGATFLPGMGLTTGPKGVQATNSSSPSGRVIESVNGTNRTGLVWSGPGVIVVPGNYTLNVEVVVTGANLTLHPKHGALRVTVEGFGGIPANETFTESYFTSGEWTNLTFDLSLPNPLANVNVEGFLESAQLSVAVASVSLEPADR
ncbi:MAG: DUF2079 domain-containing protein [Thermoplasmata archaeon]|jgi:uncharacterized membrane protein